MVLKLPCNLGRKPEAVEAIVSASAVAAAREASGWEAAGRQGAGGTRGAQAAGKLPGATSRLQEEEERG